MMPWPTPPQPPAPPLTRSQALRWVCGVLPARVEVTEEGALIVLQLGKLRSVLAYEVELTEKQLAERVREMRGELGLT